MSANPNGKGKPVRLFPLAVYPYFVGSGWSDFWCVQKYPLGKQTMNQNTPTHRMGSNWAKYGVPERITAVPIRILTHTITEPMR